MGSFLKSLKSLQSVLELLLSWGLPTFVSTLLFYLVIYPDIRNTAPVEFMREGLADLGFRRPAEVLALLVVLITLALGLNARTIYRVLEGILLPKVIGRALTRTHRAQWALLRAEREVEVYEFAEKEALQRVDLIDDELSVMTKEPEVGTAIKFRQVEAEKALDSARQEAERATEALNAARDRLRTDSDLHASRVKSARRRGTVLTKLEDYPQRESWLLPTRFGNLIKSFETYGNARYHLDTLTFWYELVSLSPLPLQKSEREARAAVDLFVASFSLAGLLSLSGFAIGLISGRLNTLALAAIALLSMPLLYAGARANVSDWRFSVQAIVNLGRVRLAGAYGLRMPPSFYEEMRMWEALSGFVTHGTEPWRVRLDAFRASHSAPETVNTTPQAP